MLQLAQNINRLGTESAFEVLARAEALRQKGRDVINLGIGQPDFRTPEHIVEAAIKALRDGHHGYTPATGIPELREAVARRTLTTTGIEVSPANVIVVPGGKVTMFAAILMFGEPGADILYPDPGFPIYRSMIEFTGAKPVAVPIREENGFAFSADETLSLLRYFGKDEVIAQLRDATPAERPALWRAFWRATDPNPSTPDHEALEIYFARVQEANERFRESAESGWLTDRGEVLITLGPPDEIFDSSSDLQDRGVRLIRWVFTSDRVTLDFVDDTGFGQFLLTQRSRADYMIALNRLRRGT